MPQKGIFFTQRRKGVGLHRYDMSLRVPCLREAWSDLGMIIRRFMFRCACEIPSFAILIVMVIEQTTNSSDGLDKRKNQSMLVTMNHVYPVILKKSEEGYAIGCPALPGCWSQGSTEEEAIENIKVAIKEYLEAIKESYQADDFKEIEVAV